MINKIIDGISKAINEEFGDSYEIYTEEVEQGLQEPCFSIICVEPKSDLFRQNKYHRQNQFCIHYFPSSKDKRNECFSVLERLYLAMEYITIEETIGGETVESTTRGTKMNGVYDDGVLHFFVNYDMFVNKVEDTETPMDSYDYNADI